MKSTSPKNLSQAESEMSPFSPGLISSLSVNVYQGLRRILCLTPGDWRRQFKFIKILFCLFPILINLACVKITEKPKESMQLEGYQEEIVVSGVLENPHPDSKEVWRIGARRLELQKGSRIITHGASLELEVEELISDSATLETFAEKDQKINLNLGQDGADSGAIELRVLQSASGSLKIISRGQAGGGGLPGASAEELDLGVPPEAAPGRDGIIEVEMEGRFSLERNDSFGSRPFRRIVLCGSNGTDGAHGSKGYPGGRGGIGARGGSTGSIDVQLPENGNLAVQFERLPGLGGSGGLGGVGGAGGAGGPGGRPAYDNGRQICRGGQRGPSGDPGDRGPLGGAGSMGEILSACLQKGVRAYCLDKLPK